MKKALFPGTFDPPTNGHVDIIMRASALFDEVIVGVAVNTEKRPVLTADERVEVLRRICSGLPNVRIAGFTGLAFEFANSNGCSALLRGIRTVTDFEYEYAMAVANRKLGNVETIFLVSSEEFAFLSSRLIREAASFGGDVSSFMPPEANEAFMRKIGKAR